MNRLVALTLALTVAGTGCAPAGYGYHAHSESRAERQAEGIAAAGELTGMIVNAVAAADEDEDSEADAPLAAPGVVYVYGPPPPLTPPAPRVTAPEPAHRAFDQAGALASVHDIDVDACTDDGAPHGYGHARVTFGKDGQAKTVVIDKPAGLSKSAARCLGDAIGEASVPPLDGSPVTVGATYYVK